MALGRPPDRIGRACAAAVRPRPRVGLARRQGRAARVEPAAAGIRVGSGDLAVSTIGSSRSISGTTDSSAWV